MSLQSAYMPAQLKEAMVKPKVKKDFLDPEQYSNFISNLKFVSKINEKAVACQLKDCLTDNNLDEPLQSASKGFHSTETALIKVQNDTLLFFLRTAKQLYQKQWKTLNIPTTHI